MDTDCKGNNYGHGFQGLHGGLWEIIMDTDCRGDNYGHGFLGYTDFVGNNYGGVFCELHRYKSYE
jgi:hypothetical protein